MKRAEAKAVLAMLSAAFPREPMPESTVSLWAGAVEQLEYGDAVAAVQDLVLGMDRMPSLHQLIMATNAAKRDRFAQLAEAAVGELEAEEAVQSLAEWLEDNPEYRERIDAIAKGAILREDGGTSRGGAPEDDAVRIRRVGQLLDRPRAARPRKRDDGHPHLYLLHDRCHWCGEPKPEDE